MAVTDQRERNAAKAKKKVDQRREDASGAAGWIAERAGDKAYVDEKYEEARPASGVPDLRLENGT